MSSTVAKPTANNNSKLRRANSNPNTYNNNSKSKKKTLLFGVFKSNSTSTSVCGCGLADVHDPAAAAAVSRTTTVPPSPASSINILALLPKHPNSPAADDYMSEPDPRARDLRADNYSSSSITSTATTASSSSCSTTSSSSSSFDSSGDRRRSSIAGSVIGSSIAVVKDSEDPYEDFRDSMMQMVVEKAIYSRSGLEELLKRFLELNSPCYHTVIVRAFTQIWNQVVVASNDIVRQHAGTCAGR